MIYLDTNVFVEPVLYQTVKAEDAKKLLTKVTEGKVVAATSLITWDEVFWVVRRGLGLEVAKNQGSILLQLPHLILYELTQTIVERAREFAERGVLAPRDAIHAATALVHGMQEFVSFDKQFDRVGGLHRLEPSQIK